MKKWKTDKWSTTEQQKYIILNKDIYIYHLSEDF